MSTPPAVDEELLAQAIDITQQAGEMTLRWFQHSDLDVQRKRDGTEVTIADQTVEEFVKKELAKRFPDDSVLGEEHGEISGTSERQWVVDPIDGTASFVRGVPLYSTLLALFDDHGPAIGVIVIPALGITVAAGRGRGATHNGRPCAVSTVDTLSDSFISSSSFDASWWGGAEIQAVTSCGASTRTWGDGYGYALVASGQLEAMVEPPVRPWDIAPMFTIIPEAGGRITGWDGSDSTTQAGGWLASNGLVHDELIDVLAKA